MSACNELSDGKDKNNTCCPSPPRGTRLQLYRAIKGSAHSIPPARRFASKFSQLVRSHFLQRNKTQKSNLVKQN